MCRLKVDAGRAIESRQRRGQGDARAERFDMDSAPDLLATVSLVLDATDSRKHDKILIERRANWNCPGLWVLRCNSLSVGGIRFSTTAGLLSRLMTESTDTQNVGCAELGILGPVVLYPCGRRFGQSNTR